MRPIAHMDSLHQQPRTKDIVVQHAEIDKITGIEEIKIKNKGQEIIEDTQPLNLCVFSITHDR